MKTIFTLLKIACIISVIVGLFLFTDQYNEIYDKIALAYAILVSAIAYRFILFMQKELD